MPTSTERKYRVSTPAGWDAAPGREVELGPSEGRPLSSPIRFRPLHLLAGVVLPFIAIAVEVFTGWSAEIYADPTPNRGLLLLALTVPLANLALWLRFGAATPPAWLVSRGAWLDALNAVALIVSAGYALLYLPITPVALVLSIFVIGLLPLSPYFALFTAIRMRSALRDDAPHRSVLRSLGIGAAIVLLINIPGLTTVLGLHLAGGGDYSASTRERGVQILRWAGDRGQMLRACYANDGSWIQLWHSGVSRDEARKIFYRVTGTAYDSVPRPLHAVWLFGWDENLAGTSVGSARLPGLTLATSQIDGKVDPAAATSHQDWTMEFSNRADTQAEARAVVALPEGGVVSRVTLWVHGEPRDAAFGGRAQVRQAYEAVVRARRDPLLVTTAGPGRVLVQCFPVPARGTMKIRLGITAPVPAGRLELPRIVEQNFELAPASPGAGHHSVWIDAGGSASIRRSLSDKDLEIPLQLWPAAEAPASPLVWTPDPLSLNHYFEQRWQPVQKPGRLIVVVDGSASLGGRAADIEKQLSALRLPVVRILAGGGWSQPERFEAGAFAGGADNVPALSRAQELALAKPDSVIVWIHGPQPVELSSPAYLEQFWRRRPGRARLVSIETMPGPNRVLQSLDGIVEVTSTKAHWDDLFGEIVSPPARPIWTRIQGAPPAAGDGRYRAGIDLVRLWAASRSLQLAGAGSLDNAIKVGSSYQVVTPQTGAVVLETDAQYTQAGLNPAAARALDTTATPEPASLVLFLIGVPALFTARRLVCRTKE